MGAAWPLLATAGGGCDRDCVTHANATAAAARAILPKKRFIVRGSTDEVSGRTMAMPDCRQLPPSMRRSEYARQTSCRPGPEITYFARARIARPIARPPSSVGATMWKYCHPSRAANRGPAQIANSAGGIGAEWDLRRLSMRLFAFDARRDVRAIGLSRLRRAEAQPPSHRLALHKVDTASAPARMIRKAAHLLGSTLSIFRIWFAAGFDAPMPMTLGSPLSSGPVGGALPIP
jgi:hypothetical protein